MSPRKPYNWIPPVVVTEIPKTILRMVAADQAMRERALQNGGVILSPEDNKIDRDNSGVLKRIIKLIGWPTASKVGSRASHGAWLIAQHSDHDVSFQSRCLRHMKESVEGDVSKIDIAMLEDRVRVNLGLPQIYGTQFHEVGGTFVPKPIKDPENVDRRRKEMGLDTLAQNIERMVKKYAE